jgi:hypothetical protein
MAAINSITIAEKRIPGIDIRLLKLEGGPREAYHR